MKKFYLPLVTVSMIVISCGSNNNAPISADKNEDTSVVADSKKIEATAPLDSATMMKNWTEYATPGKPHEMMASWNGTWTGEVSMWQAPGTPPQMSKSTSVNKMVMGNRYQVGTFTGNMMGQPFEGMSTLAYDNAKKMFISTWVDNKGTGVMKLEGPWDEVNKSMTLTGKAVDATAGNGKEMDIKEIFKVVDDDHQLFEMYGPAPDGKEYKMMEIKYTRKK